MAPGSGACVMCRIACPRLLTQPPVRRRGQAEEAPPHHIAALRVSALDADRLDVELTDMLRLQFTSILALFQPVRSASASQ